jgi:photosystem II stability/assembly factor-like uncharacterized protein
MPPKRLRRLSSLAVVALGAALLAPLRVPAPAASPGTGRPLPPAVREEMREKLGALRPYDQPGEAQELYRLKRAPRGEKAVPAERYLAALERMRTMPQHSTTRRAVLPSRADLAARGISAGISEITDAASIGAWSPLGPGNIGGRTRVLLIDPRQPRTMYTGAADGGVWKTTDGGASWQPLADLLANLAVNALVMDPHDSDVLYAGTGEGYFNSDSVRGAGIFKSTDGGASWSRLEATEGRDFYYVNDLAVSARDSRRVYAATDTGIFRSLDGGATWVRVYSTDVTGGCLDLALRTDRAADVLFAACGTFEQASVLRNTAAESSAAWAVVLRDSGMGRTTLAIAPSNQDFVYALASSVAPGRYQLGLHGVFRSTTGGAAGSWRAQVRNTSADRLSTLLLSNPVIASLRACGFSDSDIFLNQGWYDNVIAVDPKDPNRVWAGGVDLFRSDDGGRSWGVASYWWASDPTGNAPSYAHADQHAIAFHPRYNGTTVKTMFVGNDGGLYKTANARAAVARGDLAPCDPTVTPFSWQPLNHGYAVTQFYNGAPYPDGSTYFGGTQDNGTVRGSDAAGPGAWTEILGGDGGYVAVHPGNTSILYAENTGLSLVKSINGGTDWVDVTGDIDGGEDFLFIAPFVMDPSAPQRLWIGGNTLWRTDDGAAHWTQASRPVPGDFGIVSALAVAPSDSQHVLAGTVEGYILRNDAALSATGATRWRRSRPQEGYVSSVAFDPANPAIAYATYSTFGDVHVWKSVNGGASWTPLDGTGDGHLPDVPAHSVVVDPAHSDHLYIGTDLGVFSSLDGGQHWMVENTGFANVSTEFLTVRTGPGDARTLWAFTHGRGAWRVALP